MDLDDDRKKHWRQMASWDKKRYHREMAIYEERKSSKESEVVLPKTNGDKDDSLHVPKKRKSADGESSEQAFAAIPKKSRNG